MAYLPQMPLGWDPSTVGFGEVDPETAWYQYCSLNADIHGIPYNVEEEFEEELPPQMEQTALQVNQAGEQIRAWPTRQRYLVFNPLSQFWTWRAVAENPRRIANLAVCYAFGIVGYALALPVRVAVFVKEFFHLPISIFTNLCFDGGTDFFKNLQVRLLCLFGASGELLSGVVGLVCPPIAYLIDEKIQDNLVIHANAPFGWREEQGRGVVETVASNLVNNHERIANKSELLYPIKPQLREAVDLMASYIGREDLVTCAPLTLKQTALISLLLKWKNNLAENGDASVLDPLNAFLERYHDQINFGEHRNTYRYLWPRLKERYMPQQIVDTLILRAIKETKGEDILSISEEEFLEGKYQELTENLGAPLPQEMEFNGLYDAISSMTNAMINSDNELLTLIGKLSRLQTEAQPESWTGRLNEWWVHLGPEIE
jgi:hypothetical protein